MAKVNDSRSVKTHEALFAREHGYEVHHDLGGWYVVGPTEKRDEHGYINGRSLGSDHRPHFADCLEAWALAYKRAVRKHNRMMA